MINQKISEHLKLISQMQSLQSGGRFKSLAFEKASEAVMTVEYSKLRSVSGVGKSCIAEIEEYVRSGTTVRLLDLEEKIGPSSMMTMTRVKGIGPKTALKLWKENGLNDFKSLLDFAKSGLLEEKLAREVLNTPVNDFDRIPYEQALQMAQTIVDTVSPVCTAIKICGSIRRQTQDSKDIDIVLISDDKDKLINKISTIANIATSGNHKITARLKDHPIDVDLWMADNWHFGAALIYTTGCKDHTKELRTIARSRNFTMNEYGVFNSGCKEYTKKNQLCGETEHDVYEFFNFKYVKPEDRNDARMLE